MKMQICVLHTHTPQLRCVYTGLLFICSVFQCVRLLVCIYAIGRLFPKTFRLYSISVQIVFFEDPAKTG